jgi:hypothetical protein
MSTESAIDAYLRRVADSLPGPENARADIVAELRSAILDAADDRRAAGTPAEAAAEGSIAEFGDAHELATSFLPELAVRRARRLALGLVATAVPIGLLWAHAAQASDAGMRSSGPWHMIAAPPVPLAAAALAVAFLAALVTTAVTGRLTRWLGDRPKVAVASAAAGAFGVVALDLAILILLCIQFTGASVSLSPAPVAAAAAASAARLLFARRGARRCLALGTAS